MAATTTGIEPLFAVAYKRRYLEGGTRWKYQYVIEPTAERIIQELGINADDIETAYSLAHDPEKRIKFQADLQDYVDMGISSTINLPEWGHRHNNEDTAKTLADTIYKYCDRLRGLTVYPDGSRGGQPITPVKYEDAATKRGVVFEESEERCAGGVCGI